MWHQKQTIERSRCSFLFFDVVAANNSKTLRNTRLAKINLNQLNTCALDNSTKTL